MVVDLRRLKYTELYKVAEAASETAGGLMGWLPNHSVPPGLAKVPAECPEVNILRGRVHIRACGCVRVCDL